jgi:hypothetical protein
MYIINEIREMIIKIIDFFCDIEGTMYKFKKSDLVITCESILLFCN